MKVCWVSDVLVDDLIECTGRGPCAPRARQNAAAAGWGRPVHLPVSTGSPRPTCDNSRPRWCHSTGRGNCACPCRAGRRQRRRHRRGTSMPTTHWTHNFELIGLDNEDRAPVRELKITSCRDASFYFDNVRFSLSQRIVQISDESDISGTARFSKFKCSNLHFFIICRAATRLTSPSRHTRTVSTSTKTSHWCGWSSAAISTMCGPCKFWAKLARGWHGWKRRRVPITFFLHILL